MAQLQTPREPPHIVAIIDGATHMSLVYSYERSLQQNSSEFDQNRMQKQMAQLPKESSPHSTIYVWSCARLGKKRNDTGKHYQWCQRRKTSPDGKTPQIHSDSPFAWKYIYSTLKVLYMAQILELRHLCHRQHAGDRWLNSTSSRYVEPSMSLNVSCFLVIF